ncbi:helix-turn-helix transcriptional regulator [Fibrella sp. HMF5335]|uniref:Helix-turn-helix transcriptional regulator n=1 Tax=Fibrella rubiginis TaxID=2817060 RepID=A0A939GLI6_9BACT|nr:helix-turn-helix transcriptional regulator [Fibrella rubiginis]MBO0938627.1 helix-turn-helix transcriptional regulator [Fibrella rubiginis]
MHTVPPITYIEALGGFQGLFLLLVWLRSPNQRSWAGRFLALLVAAACTLLFWMALHDARWLAYVPDLIGLGPAIPFLFGPLLFGYLKAVVGPTFRWRRVYWLHSLPYWLVLPGHIPFYAKPFAEKQAFVSDHYTHPHLDWWGQLPVVHFVAYLPAVFSLINQHDTALKTYYSVTETLRLAWLRQLIIALGLCYGLFYLTYAVQGLHPAGNLLTFAITGLVYLIGYRQLRNPGLFNLREPTETLTDVPEVPGLLPKPPGKKYGKSELPADKSQAYAGQLETLMRQQQPYRNGQLTLPQLASKLSIAPHALSQVLNQTLNVTFYDYINGYRVDAVKQLLADARNQHLTLLALALDAGFESKAAFNNAFKKHTGLTPSQYRTQLRTGQEQGQ